MTAQDKRLRHSVVFSPAATTESLHLNCRAMSTTVEEEDDSPAEQVTLLGRVWIAVRFVILQLVNHGLLVPLVFLWKNFVLVLHKIGFQVHGATLLLNILQWAFFRPLAFLLRSVESLLNLMGLSLDGPKVREFFGSFLNGFGFAWHAVHDTMNTPTAHWKESSKRFQTFVEENGLDLEMKLAISERFLNNVSICDDVQALLGLGMEHRAEETKLTTQQLVKVESTMPSFEEATHFMHFATGVCGAAVIVGTLLETNNREEIDRLQMAGRTDGLDDLRHALTHLNCHVEDAVVGNLTTGGSMGALRHLVVVDHSAKALAFAIRGTFSMSGLISDWVSFCAPFCGGVGHVAMSEVAQKMWAMTKDKVLAKLETLPSDYEVVVTGHSLGAGVACLLNILLHCEKCIPNRKIRCFAFAPPPTFFPLDAAPEAVAATTAFIHGDDTVPFLSVYHLRRFFKSMAGLNRTTRDVKTMDFLRIDWGHEDPTPAMVESVRKADQQVLRKVKGAEHVAIPAQAVVWLQPAGEDDIQSGVPAKSFLPNMCDPLKLAELPMRVPTTQRQMLTDHLASKHEIALQNVHLEQKKK